MDNAILSFIPEMKKLNNVDMALPANLFDDIGNFTDLVQHIEGDKSVPFLLLQYLKLGALHGQVSTNEIHEPPLYQIR